MSRSHQFQSFKEAGRRPFCSPVVLMTLLALFPFFQLSAAEAQKSGAKTKGVVTVVEESKKSARKNQESKSIDTPETLYRQIEAEAREAEALAKKEEKALKKAEKLAQAQARKKAQAEAKARKAAAEKE